ncbi:autotransporter strand-loop-strand O-heptosyltransferase, partial [Caballeronia sp. LZ029]|nr:autotransporter strand-loop-strand O-heptosyltransferase [Caballeronia sp. LZ029]
ETDIGAGAVTSGKKYFVPFELEVQKRGKDADAAILHRYDAKDREVLIQFPVGTLGDLMGWFPYAVKFQRKHGCRLTCSMSALIAPLFRRAYPEIKFITPEEVDPARYYATYNI